MNTWTQMARLFRRPRTSGRTTPVTQCESGSTAVEFALIVPVFLLFLTGIFQFGMIMFVQNNMSHVARDVSRRIAVGEMTAVEAQSSAQGTLINWGIDYTVQVTEPDPSDPTDRNVTVFIAAPMKQAAMFDILGILEGSSLAASVTMRLEG